MNTSLHVPFDSKTLYEAADGWKESLNIVEDIVENDGNGTGTADPVSVVMGTEITLTATPNNGYEFDRWEVISGNRQ
jgi:hypothetical protein